MISLATYPNQKRVKIIKNETDKLHPYAIINIEALRHIVNSNLSDRAVRLWLCFASNQDGYEFELSPAYIQKEWGFSDSTYKRAKADLVAAGYLRQTMNGNWEFYEMPQTVSKWDF